MNKLLILSSLSFMSFFSFFTQDKETVQETNIQTTFIILRHAEKENTDKDTNLSNEGKSRAEALRNMLSNVDVNAIYSTSYNRTRQTVQPLATEKGITITEYPAQKPYNQLIDEILTTNSGKTVVIVGHSNTVPEILKVLSSNNYNVTINEDQFDKLFIVYHTKENNSKIVQLKYGKNTP